MKNLQKLVNRGLAKRRALKIKSDHWKKIQGLREGREDRIRQKNYVQIKMATQLQSFLDLKEDWKLGSIAPRRHSGLHIKNFGFLPSMAVNGPSSHKSAADFIKKQRKQGALRNVFAKGDRVVIIRGPNKGQIKTISEISSSLQEAVLHDHGEVNYIVPESMSRQLGWSEALIGVPQRHGLGVKLEDLRLVIRLGDQDVIIDRMEIVGSSWDKKRGLEMPLKRIVPGTSFEIPTPDVAGKEKLEEDEEIGLRGDDNGTRDASVSRVNFVPSMTEPPFKVSIIDELRRKFSTTRVRYLSDGILRKLQRKENERRIMEQSVRLMEPPQAEYARRENQLLRESLPKEPSQQTLNALGKQMMRSMKISGPEILKKRV